MCRRLEGIPLGIELDAVQLRFLPLRELADRLDGRFQVLREGARDLPERHRTLSVLIGWSHDLCTPAEQLLSARASVFAGAGSRPTRSKRCAHDRALPASILLDTLAGLVDESVLAREEHRGQVRFRMLETISEYGQGRLADSSRRVVPGPATPRLVRGSRGHRPESGRGHASWSCASITPTSGWPSTPRWRVPTTCPPGSGSRPSRGSGRRQIT
ncbi:hypothetical protein GCM10027597_25910 [Saccharopolyspora tripterygii]